MRQSIKVAGQLTLVLIVVIMYLNPPKPLTATQKLDAHCVHDERSLHKLNDYMTKHHATDEAREWRLILKHCGYSSETTIQYRNRKDNEQRNKS